MIRIMSALFQAGDLELLPLDIVEPGLLHLVRWEIVQLAGHAALDRRIGVRVPISQQINR